MVWVQCDYYSPTEAAITKDLGLTTESEVINQSFCLEVSGLFFV